MAHRHRPLVLGTLIISMFMGSIEGTIIATAMPDIVANLGGFSLYSWVFSSYLLMQAVSIPIFGKLADLFGRKPVFIAGTVIFLVGSILCGLAPSMTWLIVFRFVQGLGAGAIQPISLTIVGDIYTIEERARIQGWLASVWGVSSVLGPLAGGLIVEYWHWSWVFWINVPFGILAIIGLAVFLREDFERKRHKVDYLGAALFFVSIGSLMMVLIQGGVEWDWNSPVILGLSALAVGAFIAFLMVEARASEPIMPLDLWRKRLIATANIMTLAAGMVMIGLTTFLPTYVQGVMGESAIRAGFALTAMSVGWPIAATITGRLLTRLGNRRPTLVGGCFLTLGGGTFLLMTGSSGPLYAAFGSFLVGCGLGMLNTSTVVSIQSSVEWARRGVATASNMFMRILGNALGAAVFGSVLNSMILSHLAAAGSGLGLEEFRLLLDSGVASVRATPELLAALTAGLDAVYTGVFAASVLTLLLALLMPEVIRRSRQGKVERT